MPAVASFHLTRYPARRAPAAMAGMVGNRRALASQPGLRFARLLGTGRGSAMGPGADLCRWATLAFWEHEPALDAFLACSPVATRWRDRGLETWSVRLAPLSAHGSWGGSSPLPEMAGRPREGGQGAVAVLTRATIPLRHWWAFTRSIGPVDADLRHRPGLLATCGIGEAPVGRLATFSLWRSAEAVEAFAYGGSAHHRVVERARREGWLAEELFARFRPYGSTGTWDGRDPLAGGNGS